MKVIELTKGFATIVDDEDFDLLAQYRWSIHNLGYAARTPKMVGGIRPTKRVLMHRQIMNAPDGVEVDHINGNKLDNRRCNLRFANHAQNGMNRGPRSDSSTGVKGVYFSKQKKKFHAEIRSNGVKKNLGFYTDLKEASDAYDRGAILYHGEFARLNSMS